ncbi:MAG: hypothetical protein AB8B97_12600 [Granulosicoccus sp.]
MHAHRKARLATLNQSLALVVCLTATFLFTLTLPPVVRAIETDTSAQLLQSYFDTAGVCTNSSVNSIVEENKGVIVNIAVEAATAQALLSASGKLRDDWFSLHCPPEIHGVWTQPQPPVDVLISGALDATENHSLSCRDYQNMQTTRTLSFSDRVRAALERMLSH